MDLPNTQNFDPLNPTRNFGSELRVVFIGNPGAGKSSLLNGLIGEEKFESGISFDGTGVTKKFSIQEYKGVIYVDTPGLDDDQFRKESAEEITKALKIGGKFLICFVLTLESGRIRPSDSYTIEFVMDSAPQIGSNFGIIINKLEPKLISNETHAAIYQQLGLNFPKSSLFLYPNDEELIAGKKIPTLPPSFIEFIQKIPQTTLDPDKVIPIEASLLDLKKKKGEDKILSLQNQIEQDKMEFLRQKQVQEDEYQRKMNELKITHSVDPYNQKKVDPTQAPQTLISKRFQDSQTVYQSQPPTHQELKPQESQYSQTIYQNQPSQQTYPIPLHQKDDLSFQLKPQDSQYSQTIYQNQPSQQTYPVPLHLQKEDLSFHVNLVLLGNPGSGKSTFLNGLLERDEFPSGISLDGSGVTKELKVVSIGQVHFVDTPGLDDDQCRDQCASEITKALKLGGLFVICFVVSVQDGYVNPADKITIKMILDSAPQIGPNYSVIFNRLSPNFMNPTFQQQLCTQLFSSLQFSSNFVFFYPLDHALYEKSGIPTLSEEFCKFIHNTPKCFIDSSQVVNIRTQEWGQVSKQYQVLLEKLKTDHDFHRQTLLKYMEQLERERKIVVENQQRIMQQKAEEIDFLRQQFMCYRDQQQFHEHEHHNCTIL